jgi:3-hydroxymyristoyl/3-hydroxydecanoyl-(acyl carrier protein) dehydratase
MSSPKPAASSPGNLGAARHVLESDGVIRDAATALCHIAVDHPAFAGHFPGRPVLPGAVLLAEVLAAIQAAPALAGALGAAPVLTAAKFLLPVAPGSDLVIELRLQARRLGFVVLCQGVPVAKGQFAAGESE